MNHNDYQVSTQHHHKTDDAVADVIAAVVLVLCLSAMAIIWVSSH